MSGNYKSYNLDELCEFIRNGKSVKQTKEINGLPITRIETIANQKVDSNRVGYASLSEKEAGNYILKNGDILFSHINSLEHLFKTAMYEGYPEKLVHGMNLLCLRPNQDLILPKYLLLLLKTPIVRSDLMRYANKSVNQASISVGNLKKLILNIPPLSEQKRIAEILDKADELRQKRQQSIEKLDELLQTTFIDMFGDPVSNPKGWETKPLKNFALKVQSGNTPKGGKENYLKEGITFFRSQNVWKNKIIYDDIAFIDEETHKKMLGSSLKHKDILMTKTGRINTENSSLGRAAIYLGEDDKANLNGHVYLIRLSEKVNPFFILSILTLPSYYEYIRSLCVGGIDKRQLNKEHIESFSIIYPPIELQDKFAKIKQNIEQQKQILIKQLEQQENLFQSLQQRAFNGEL